MDILISGAGIAGPTLAFWLARFGHCPVIVERAPRLRQGGYIIDFWGAGYDVAEQMGLTPQLREQGYRLKAIRFEDARHRKAGGFATDVLERATRGRYISLPRSALSTAIHGAISDDVEVIWGDSISEIHQDGARTFVAFERASPRIFDLVVGADGLHSNVRRLGFGAQHNFESYLGYKVAAFEVEGYRPRAEDTYVSFGAPGRQAARFAMRDNLTMILLVYADPSPEMPDDSQWAMKAALHEAFDNLGWECPEILEALDCCGRVYFDRVSQIAMPTWSNRRLVLVGDAAACPSLLAGEGAALGMLAAYTLAGELGISENPQIALSRYEAVLRPFLASKQAAARKLASSFAPRTSAGLLLRNVLSGTLAIPGIADFLFGRSLRDRILVPDYATMLAPLSPRTGYRSDGGASRSAQSQPGASTRPAG